MTSAEEWLDKRDQAKDMRQMRACLEEIRERASNMENGGAWASGMAMLCLGTLSSRKKMD